jgi:predicted O-methyltransferase YrrM
MNPSNWSYPKYLTIKALTSLIPILILEKMPEKFITLSWIKRREAGKIQNVNNIFTFTTENELRQLYKLASECDDNSSVLEIGSYLGASSCYLGAGLAKNRGHLFCVDTWSNETMPDGIQDTFLTFKTNIENVKDRITFVRKRSDELTIADIKLPLDLVFIDGDHSYEATKADFEMIQPWLAKNGIVAFHDFCNPEHEGVARVVGEALADGKWIMLGKVDTLTWIKLSYTESP